MTASGLFQMFNTLALLGWIVLGVAVLLRRSWMRDAVCGTYIPVALSAAYCALIALFFFQAPGGFDSLENVQRLFTSPWTALAGWAHYLAFDLFMGARAARGFEEMGLARWPLVLILPLIFMFGPAGYLAFEIIKASVTRSRNSLAV
jgi:Domain of unknown function (DUF4281)